MREDDSTLPPTGSQAGEVQNDAARSLGSIVEQEARRVLSEAQLESDPARVADGWERRFVADGRRAEEMMELYRQLGFEVVADPIRPEHLSDDCQDCKLLMLLEFKMIYTRKPPSG